jgi:hypothetical protein
MRKPTVLAVAALVATACGDTPSIETSAPPTTVATVTTTTLVTTTTVADTSEPWDLVWFSDSTGNFVAGLWAERIEQDLGVEVRVHDFAGSGEEGSAVFILDRIENESVVRDALAEAEIIGLYASPMFTETGDALADACLQESSTPRDPPERYSREDFEPYAELLRSIYNQMFELRAGQPTVVRAFDMYTPVLDAWMAAGVEPECTAGWEAMASTVRDVASEYGVPTASAYDTFNGPNHDEDPVTKGFIGSDGVHPSSQGNAAEADVLHDLGYDPIAP